MSLCFVTFCWIHQRIFYYDYSWLNNWLYFFTAQINATYNAIKINGLISPQNVLPFPCEVCISVTSLYTVLVIIFSCSVMVSVGVLDCQCLAGQTLTSSSPASKSTAITKGTSCWYVCVRQMSRFTCFNTRERLRIGLATARQLMKLTTTPDFIDPMFCPSNSLDLNPV